MLHTVADELSDLSPSALQTAYEDRLRAVITAAGAETVAAETDIDVDRLDDLAAGETPSFSLTEAGAILAVDDETPDVDAIVYELRDHLLMGMTTSVLDVDTIAANVDTDLTAQEVQQAIEGRAEMTLAQLAEIQSVIDSRER